jgi:hypothetical protein
MALVVYFDEVGNSTLEVTDRHFSVFALTDELPLRGAESRTGATAADRVPAVYSYEPWAGRGRPPHRTRAVLWPSVRCQGTP